MRTNMLRPSVSDIHVTDIKQQVWTDELKCIER